MEILFESISESLLVSKRKIERAVLFQDLGSTSWFFSYRIEKELRFYGTEGVPRSCKVYVFV